jgi:hypothetical protein
MRSPTGRFVAYPAVVVLILGVVSTGTGLVVGPSRQAQDQMVVPVPYTMVSNQIFFKKTGEKGVLQATKTRYVRGDGSFKVVTTSYKPDGSVLGSGTGFGITGRGVFGVDDKSQKLLFISGKDRGAHPLNEEQFRNDPFSREDVVLGYKVRVLRLPDTSDNKTYSELYFAPDLANAIVKIVNAGADGSSQVIEAVKIDVGEPSASEFNLPNYPVDYGPYERRIAEEKAQGHPDLANEMRQIEEAAKAKSP